jgi:hypothetical protein
MAPAVPMKKVKTHTQNNDFSRGTATRALMQIIYDTTPRKRKDFLLPYSSSYIWSHFAWMIDTGRRGRYTARFKYMKEVLPYSDEKYTSDERMEM